MTNMLLKRIVWTALLVSGTSWLCAYPYLAGWILVGMGWSMHTRFYETALMYWTYLGNNNEQALRARALVHSYRKDCSQAMHIYEDLLQPLRKRLYTVQSMQPQERQQEQPQATNQQEDTGETTTTTTSTTFVQYRPGEVFDYLQIYDTCAGQTAQAFALANEAQDRLLQTLRRHSSMMQKMAQQKQREMSMTDWWYMLYFGMAVGWGEMASGRIMHAMTPVAVTHLALTPTHQEYLALIDTHLSNLTFSQHAIPSLLPPHRHWQTEPLASIAMGYGLAATFHEQFPHQRMLRWTLTVLGGIWRFRGILQQRSMQYTLGQIIMQVDKLDNTHKAPQKLALLERARQCIVEAPTRPFDLLHGLAVVVVGEATEAMVYMGRVDMVDHLVPILVQLWQAKQQAEAQLTSPTMGTKQKTMKHLTAEYVTEMYIMAPARVRWGAGVITNITEFHQMMEHRAEQWKALNVTDIPFELKPSTVKGNHKENNLAHNEF